MRENRAWLDFKGCQKLLIKMNYDEGFAAAFGRVSLGFFLVTRLHYMKVAGIFNLGGVWQQSFMGKICIHESGMGEVVGCLY